MKKLLNISVIAALAILPLAANAAVTDADPGATVTGDTAATATAQNPAKYGLAQPNANVDGVVATAGYVKGAYNAAIKAINKVSETAANALTADGEATLTHKTIDANGTGNSITNLETDNFASGVIVTTVGAEGADTSLPTEQAVREAITTATDGMVTETKTQTLTNKTISGGTISNATITGGTIDASSTTISNLDTGDFASGVVRDSTATIRAVASAEDDKLVTEKAVATAIEGLGIGNYATKTGVETTVTNALNAATVDISGLAVDNGALTGTATASVPVVDTWGATASTGDIDATVSLSNVQTNVTLSGDANNVAVHAGTVAYPAN